MAYSELGEHTDPLCRPGMPKAVLNGEWFYHAAVARLRRLLSASVSRPWRTGSVPHQRAAYVRLVSVVPNLVRAVQGSHIVSTYRAASERRGRAETVFLPCRDMVTLGLTQAFPVVALQRLPNKSCFEALKDQVFPTNIYEPMRRLATPEVTTCPFGTPQGYPGLRR